MINIMHKLESIKNQLEETPEDSSNSILNDAINSVIIEIENLIDLLR